MSSVKVAGILVALTIAYTWIIGQIINGHPDLAPVWHEGGLITSAILAAFTIWRVDQYRLNREYEQKAAARLRSKRSE